MLQSNPTGEGHYLDPYTTASMLREVSYQGLCTWQSSKVGPRPETPARKLGKEGTSTKKQNPRGQSRSESQRDQIIKASLAYQRRSHFVPKVTLITGKRREMLSMMTPLERVGLLSHVGPQGIF